MESLVKATSEFLGAVLGALGLLGRARRRALIRQDLELLRDLEQSPDDFGRTTPPHTALVSHITFEVFRYSTLHARKSRPWSSIVLAALFAGGLGYLTFRIVENGFHWYALLPGAFALLFMISLLGMLFPSESDGDTLAAEPAPAEGEGPAAERDVAREGSS